MIGPPREFEVQLYTQLNVLPAVTCRGHLTGDFGRHCNKGEMASANLPIGIYAPGPDLPIGIQQQHARLRSRVGHVCKRIKQLESTAVVGGSTVSTEPIVATNIDPTGLSQEGRPLVTGVN